MEKLFVLIVTLILIELMIIRIHGDLTDQQWKGYSHSNLVQYSYGPPSISQQQKQIKLTLVTFSVQLQCTTEQTSQPIVWRKQPCEESFKGLESLQSTILAEGTFNFFPELYNLEVTKSANNVTSTLTVRNTSSITRQGIFICQTSMQEQDNFLLGNEESLKPCLQRRYNQHEERESKYMATAYGLPYDQYSSSNNQWYNSALYYNNWGSKYPYSHNDPKTPNPYQPQPNAHSYTQVLPLGSSYSERSPSNVLASPIDPTSLEGSSVDDSYFPIRDEHGTGPYPNSVEHNYFKPSIGYPYNDLMKPILGDVSNITQGDAENTTSTIENINDDMNSSANSTTIASNEANDNVMISLDNVSNDPPKENIEPNNMKMGLEKIVSLPITTKVHISNNNDNQTGLKIQYGDAIGKEKNIRSNLIEPTIKNTNMKDFLAKENHSNLIPVQMIKIVDMVNHTKSNGVIEVTDTVPASNNEIDILHKQDTNMTHMKINSESNINHKTSKTNASQQVLPETQIMMTENRNMLMLESSNNSDDTIFREHFEGFNLNKPNTEELQNQTQVVLTKESSNQNNSTREFQTKLDNFLTKYMMKTKYTSEQTNNVSSDYKIAKIKPKQPNYVSILSVSKFNVPQESHNWSDSFRIKQNYSKVYFYPSYKNKYYLKKE